jgi:hypothetical protein
LKIFVYFTLLAKAVGLQAKQANRDISSLHAPETPELDNQRDNKRQHSNHQRNGRA